jgi:hypothetical protein
MNFFYRNLQWSFMCNYSSINSKKKIRNTYQNSDVKLFPTVVAMLAFWSMPETHQTFQRTINRIFMSRLLSIVSKFSENVKNLWTQMMMDEMKLQITHNTHMFLIKTYLWYILCYHTFRVGKTTYNCKKYMFIYILMQMNVHNFIWFQYLNDTIQLLTFVEVKIRIYRSKIYDIYRGRSRGKHHISWNDRSLY